MTIKKESAEEFIKRKGNLFKKHNTIQVKDIGRTGVHYFIREAWTFLAQSNLKEKVFVIERLRKESTIGKLAYDNWKKGDIEYRIGYYIVGRVGRAKGKWIWGQFCPMIPQNDLGKLLDKARKERTIIY
ncbi:MAG: hypothetical protein NTZ93_03155 [Candidatus Beckwithbacteria bacterium]|nr:hypothetical protein [Candidatus Beckwithbacteria bacterium]